MPNPTTDPYQVVQFKRSATPQGTGITNTSTISLPNAVAAAGRLIRATISVDKNAGAFTTPSGWTLIPGSDLHAPVGVTTASYYKFSTASETPSITFQWTTANGSYGAIWETNLDSTFSIQGTSATGVTTTNTVSATYATALTSAAYVEAIAAIDTASGGKWVAAGPVWSGTYTNMLSAYDAAEALVDSGGTGFALAVDRPASGVTPTVSTTTNSGGADEQALVLTAWASTAPAAPSLLSRWVGGVAPGGFSINTKTSGTASVRIRVGATTSTPTTVEISGHAHPKITGLAANTEHNYEVLAADDSVIGTGTVKTAAPSTAPANFSFAFSSCIDNNVNPVILTTIANRNPAFFLMTGDYGYPDSLRTDQTNLSFYTENYDRVSGQSHVANLISSIPTDYIPDDHDGTDGNDSDSLGEGRGNMHTAYRQRVAHYDLPAINGALYHTFTYGRVRFVVWDCRSDRTPNTATDNSSKTMLGASQKQWFKDLIAAETLPLVVIVSSVVWNAAKVAGEDDWGGFDTERQELIASMNAAVPDFMLITGDAHMLAADNGTNSPGGFANVSAAPLQRPNSTKGGPWSQGTYASSTNQYGWIDVTDSGTNITVAFSGISAEGTTRISLTESYAAPSTPAPGSTYGEFVLINSSLTQVSTLTYLPENSVELTQAQYNALATRDPAITYYITG